MVPYFAKEKQSFMEQKRLQSPAKTLPEEDAFPRTVQNLEQLV